MADYTPEQAEYWASQFSALDESDEARDRSEDILAEAQSDQRDRTARDAERYKYCAYPSQAPYPQLSHSDRVQEKRQDVMWEHHRLLEQGLVESYEGPNRAAGVPAGGFDSENPEHARRVHLIFAASPHRLHGIRSDSDLLSGYSVQDALDAELKHRNTCGWIGPKCFTYAKQFLLPVDGVHVVAVATCQYCLDWLARGCPEVRFPKPPPPHLGNIRRR